LPLSLTATRFSRLLPFDRFYYGYKKLLPHLTRFDSIAVPYKSLSHTDIYTSPCLMEVRCLGSTLAILIAAKSKNHST